MKLLLPCKNEIMIQIKKQVIAISFLFILKRCIIYICTNKEANDDNRNKIPNMPDELSMCCSKRFVFKIGKPLILKYHILAIIYIDIKITNRGFSFNFLYV